jgi:hypothetical protein
MRLVRRRAAALKVAALIAGGVALLPRCLTIDGGAIELSWVVYCANGRQPGCGPACCSCDERAASLTRVQLVLTGVSDGAATNGCDGKTTCRFDASAHSGNTGFFVPPGDYELTLLPLDASGQVLGGPSCVPDGSAGSCWQTPVPLRRTVNTGEVVSLGSFLIAVPDCPTTASCANSCPSTP